MSWGFLLRMVGRELDRQKGRLLLIALCLSLGFAAFAATYGFSARVLGAIHSESRGILGGDAALNATGLMPEDLEAKVRALPEVDRVCLVYDFATMASVEDLPPKLVEVRAASLLAGRLTRQRDLALLRTLGASHGTLLSSLLWEFLLIGASAALIAGVMARMLSDLYAKKVLELPTHGNPWAAPLLLLAAAVLTMTVGLLGSWRALNAKPLDVLRSE